ncbi:MAG TPA: hypothetical protein VNZ47_15405 [Candidatus Dormibacteraeota bacterium]|jgi:hypothetical protein|nr:hypothetical protein [Candidatus Dormibacteraeota bacterium]
MINCAPSGFSALLGWDLALPFFRLINVCSVNGLIQFQNKPQLGDGALPLSRDGDWRLGLRSHGLQGVEAGQLIGGASATGHQASCHTECKDARYRFIPIKFASMFNLFMVPLG